MEIMRTVESISEDIFQCGRCKLAFTSLTMFLDHKREPCATLIWPTQVPGVACSGTDSQETYASRAPISAATPHSSAVDQRLYVTPSAARAPVAAVEPLRVACIQCRKTFKRMKSLSLHLKTHASERGFQCPVCGRCFMQNTHLQRHLASHRVWPDGLSRTVPSAQHPPAPSSAYACAYCNLLLPNYTKFRVHLKSHTSEKVYMCIQSGCSGLFRDLDLLLQHVRESHSNPTYHCHLCAFTHSCLEELAKHQQNHSKFADNPKVELKYECPRCDASFKSLEKLTYHTATHDHLRSCVRCDKSFSSEKRLRSHMRTHEEVRPFPCHVCGASFRIKKYLETHLLRHGEKKHACPICSLKFKRKDMLSRHLGSHSARKRWDCPFKEQLGCQLQFTRSDKMKLHLRSHAKRISSGHFKLSENSRGKVPAPTMEIVIIPVKNRLVLDGE